MIKITAYRFFGRYAFKFNIKTLFTCNGRSAKSLTLPSHKLKVHSNSNYELAAGTPCPNTLLNVLKFPFQNSQARVAEAMDGILNFLPKNKKQE